HGAGAAEALHHGSHRRRLLSDCDIDADDAGALLVDDRVDGDCRLACSAIADDELALSAADRDHGVNGLDAGLERLLHGLPDDDSRCVRLHLTSGGSHYLGTAVNGTAKRVYYASDQRRADRHLEHASRAADFIALLELEVVAEDNGADVVFLEVECEGGDNLAGFGRSDLEHLSGHGAHESVDASDTVLDLENGAYLFNVERREVSSFDLAEEDILDLA